MSNGARGHSMKNPFTGEVYKIDKIATEPSSDDGQNQCVTQVEISDGLRGVRVDANGVKKFFALTPRTLKALGLPVSPEQKEQYTAAKCKRGLVGGCSGPESNEEDSGEEDTPTSNYRIQERPNSFSSAQPQPFMIPTPPYLLNKQNLGNEASNSGNMETKVAQPIHDIEPVNPEKVTNSNFPQEYNISNGVHNFANMPTNLSQIPDKYITDPTYIAAYVKKLRQTQGNSSTYSGMPFAAQKPQVAEPHFYDQMRGINKTSASSRVLTTDPKKIEIHAVHPRLLTNFAGNLKKTETHVTDPRLVHLTPDNFRKRETLTLDSKIIQTNNIDPRGAEALQYKPKRLDSLSIQRQKIAKAVQNLQMIPHDIDTSLLELSMDDFDFEIPALPDPKTTPMRIVGSILANVPPDPQEILAKMQKSGIGVSKIRYFPTKDPETTKPPTLPQDSSNIETHASDPRRLAALAQNPQKKKDHAHSSKKLDTNELAGTQPKSQVPDQSTQYYQQRESTTQDPSNLITYRQTSTVPETNLHAPALHGQTRKLESAIGPNNLAKYKQIFPSLHAPATHGRTRKLESATLDPNNLVTYKQTLPVPETNLHAPATHGQTRKLESATLDPNNLVTYKQTLPAPETNLHAPVRHGQAKKLESATLDPNNPVTSRRTYTVPETGLRDSRKPAGQWQTKKLEPATLDPNSQVTHRRIYSVPETVLRDSKKSATLGQTRKFESATLDPSNLPTHKQTGTVPETSSNDSKKPPKLEKPRKLQSKVQDVTNQKCHVPDGNVNDSKHLNKHKHAQSNKILDAKIRDFKESKVATQDSKVSDVKAKNCKKLETQAHTSKNPKVQDCSIEKLYKYFTVQNSNGQSIPELASKETENKKPIIHEDTSILSTTTSDASREDINQAKSACRHDHLYIPRHFENCSILAHMFAKSIDKFLSRQLEKSIERPIRKQSNAFCKLGGGDFEDPKELITLYEGTLNMSSDEIYKECFNKSHEILCEYHIDEIISTECMKKALKKASKSSWEKIKNSKYQQFQNELQKYLNEKDNRNKSQHKSSHSCDSVPKKIQVIPLTAAESKRIKSDKVNLKKQLQERLRMQYLKRFVDGENAADADDETDSDARLIAEQANCPFGDKLKRYGSKAYRYGYNAKANKQQKNAQLRFLNEDQYTHKNKSVQVPSTDLKRRQSSKQLYIKRLSQLNDKPFICTQQDKQLVNYVIEKAVASSLKKSAHFQDLINQSPIADVPNVYFNEPPRLPVDKKMRIKFHPRFMYRPGDIGDENGIPPEQVRRFNFFTGLGSVVYGLLAFGIGFWIFLELFSLHKPTQVVVEIIHMIVGLLEMLVSYISDEPAEVPTWSEKLYNKLEFF